MLEQKPRIRDSVQVQMVIRKPYQFCYFLANRTFCLNSIWKLISRVDTTRLSICFSKYPKDVSIQIFWIKIQFSHCVTEFFDIK